MEFGLGADAAVDAGQLQCPRQTQLLRFNGPGDDGPVFPASPTGPIAYQYRGQVRRQELLGGFEQGRLILPQD